jgi:hypothetical protein
MATRRLGRDAERCAPHGSPCTACARFKARRRFWPNARLLPSPGRDSPIRPAQRLSRSCNSVARSRGERLSHLPELGGRGHRSPGQPTRLRAAAMRRMGQVLAVAAAVRSTVAPRVDLCRALRGRPGGSGGRGHRLSRRSLHPSSKPTDRPICRVVRYAYFLFGCRAPDDRAGDESARHPLARRRRARACRCLAVPTLAPHGERRSRSDIAAEVVLMQGDRRPAHFYARFGGPDWHLPIGAKRLHRQREALDSRDRR